MKTEAVADEDPLTREIISAAIELHRFFGPGLLESIYERVFSVRSVPRWLIFHFFSKHQ